MSTVSDTLFHSLSAFRGGAIFYSSPASTLHILQCIFVLCSSSDNGGAVYSVSNALSVKKSCFESCNALRFVFMHFEAPNSEFELDTLHKIYDVSKSNTIRGYTDYNKIKTMNMSSINLGYYSLPEICGATSFNVSFCSFISSFSRQMGIYAYSCRSLFLLDYSNFVNASSPDGYGIIAVNNNKLECIKCIIHSNIGYLFYIHISGSINVNECWIHHTYATGVDLSNNHLTKTQTYIIDHLNTAQCQHIGYGTIHVRSSYGTFHLSYILLQYFT